MVLNMPGLRRVWICLNMPELHRFVVFSLFGASKKLIRDSQKLKFCNFLRP